MALRLMLEYSLRAEDKYSLKHITGLFDHSRYRIDFKRHNYASICCNNKGNILEMYFSSQ